MLYASKKGQTLIQLSSLIHFYDDAVLRLNMELVFHEQIPRYPSNLVQTAGSLYCNHHVLLRDSGTDTQLMNLDQREGF